MNQKLFFSFLTFMGLFVGSVAAQTYDVTFRVNMNEVIDPFTTPEVNGTFNGWCGGCAPMADPELDGIWELTIALTPGVYEFKYAADAWTIQENLTPGTPCTVTNGGFTNRIVTVVDQNIDLGTVCWGSCQDCGVAPAVYNVTFHVDMNEVVAPFTTPEVNGSFNGWCGGCAPMTDPELDGVWTITIPLEVGSYEFKYAADAWTIQESLTPGSPCTVTNGGFTNRALTVVDQDIDLGVVCWGSCAACSGGTGGGDCNIAPLTFDDASSVSAWQLVADATLPEASMVWNPAGVTTGALEISGTNTVDGVGRAYIFQYVDGAVDYAGNTSVQLSFDLKLAGPLVGAALHLQTEFPGVGTVNNFDLQTQGLNENTWTTYTYNFNGVGAGSLFRMHFNIAAGAFIGAGGTVLVDNIQLTCGAGGDTPGCTNSGALNYNPSATIDDGSCQYNVTFRVDMAEVVDPYTTPEVNGDFNGWCGGCAPMTNIGGTVWELTIPLGVGTYEFKYAADSWTIQEALTPGDPCTITTDIFTNRTLSVVDQNVDLGTVCWNSCSACVVNPVTYNVTFRVDMANVVDPYTTPEVNGTFNGWCGGCAPMTNVGGSVWELTIALEPGTYEFKYAADAWAIQESLTPGAPCTVTNFGFTNRFLEVVDQDIDLGTVCWAACQACGVAPNVYDVTFRVDMNQVMDPFTTPEVNGSFNGWCGGCAPMADPELDGVWEITIPLEEGVYEYKFAADAWNIQENLAPGSPCTITTDIFTNRLIDVTGDITLDVVCWGSCSACESQVAVTFQVDMFNEVVSPNGVHLAGNFQGWDPAANPMTYMGYGIWRTTVMLDAGASYEYKFINGNDFSGAELISGACEVNGNRGLVAPPADTMLPVVCFASCDACAGCTDPFFAEFNLFAGSDDGSCLTPMVMGCTYMDATNYDPSATEDDGSCMFIPVDTCPSDLNNDGITNTADLVIMLSSFGSPCN